MVKKEALWVLSNITTTQDTDIINKVEELGAIKHLSELVGRGAFDIRKGVSTCMYLKGYHTHLNLFRLLTVY